MMIEPTEREIAYIRESLYRFNDATVGEDHHAPLHLTEKNADGEILGGILGGTYWGWMYVDILCVLRHLASRRRLRRRLLHPHRDHLLL